MKNQTQCSAKIDDMVMPTTSRHLVFKSSGTSAVATPATSSDDPLNVWRNKQAGLPEAPQVVLLR